MKRILTLSAVALVAMAATANAAGMYGGIKAGANFANVSDIDGSSMKTGFMGGAFVGKDVNEQFGFRVEGLYVQKGAKFDIPATTLTPAGEVTAKADYIEFPILFVYNLSNSETMGFNVFAGPTLGFNISASTDPETAGVDPKDNTESFEFGAAIGAGLIKKMAGGKGITLDARYSLGATGVNKEDFANGDNPKNRGIGVMLGYQIPIGGSAQ